MFNPAYVLPTFLGVCCAGLVIWNVRMTGDIDKLEINLDKALDDNEAYEKKVAELVERNEKTSGLYLEGLKARGVLNRENEVLSVGMEQAATVVKGYQQDVDTLREERRIQEQKIDGAVAQNLEYIQTILDLEKTVKDFTGMINTLNNKIPKRDESGKFKKKK